MDKIRLELFDSNANYSNHIDLIREWIKKRNMDESFILELPVFGFVCYYDELPIAMAFIRRCESSVMIFDSLIADPESDPIIRDQCVDVLVSKILSEAKKKRIDKVIAFSNQKRTLDRAFRHGFIKTDYQVITLNLKDKESL